MRLLFSIVCALLLVLSLTSSTGATTLLRVELDDLTRQSDRVLRGHVQLERSEVDPRTGVIVSVWSLVPSETMAGAETLEPVEVVTLGGRIGSIGQAVVGAAGLSENQELIVFLEDLSEGRSRVVAMAQGVFTVRREEQAELVERPAGLEVYDTSRGGYVRLKDFSVGLEEFRRRIAAARLTP